jgi:hypothetical protein
VSIHKPAEEKVSDHLLRKRYWEDKVATAREDHDDCKDVNYDVVLPRTQVTIMRAEKKSIHSTDKSDDKRTTSVFDEIDCILSEYEEDTTTIKSSDVSTTMIEKRVKCGVRMSNESVRSKMFTVKPELKMLAAAKRQAEIECQKFYGPQLQIPWSSSTTSGSDSRRQVVDDSPTKEVEELLSHKQQHTRSTDDFADAFVTSTLNGIMRTGHRFDTSPGRMKTTSKHVATDTKDYIGPQIIKEWSSNMTGKYNTYNMDITTGRESIHILGKHQKRVVPFESTVQQTDVYGPGYYKIDSNFGDDAKGAAFSKLHESCDDSNIVEDQCLDLDAMESFNRVNTQTRSFALYTKVLYIVTI